eukprot:9329354-Pyramimonas_sp.AAC.1
MESEFTRKVCWIMTEPVMWDTIIRPSWRTLRLSCYAFRFLSGAAGVFEEEMHARHRRQPFETFRLDLGGDGGDPDFELAERFMSMPACLLGAFGVLHRDFATARGGYFAEAAVLCRRHLARHARLTIMDLESIHASINRRLRAAGLQTHPTDIVYQQALWVLDCWRRRAAGLNLWTDLGEPTLDEADGDSSDDDPDPVRGGGGLWRLFVRLKRLGCKGRADFAALSAEYNAGGRAAMSAAQVEIASAATARHREGYQGASSFGAKSRDVRRLQRSAQDQASLTASLALPMPDPSEGILAMAPQPRVQQTAIALAVQVADTPTIQAAYAAGRGLMRASSARERAAVRAADEAVQRWSSEQGRKSERAPSGAATAPINHYTFEWSGLASSALAAPSSRGVRGGGVG